MIGWVMDKNPYEQKSLKRRLAPFFVVTLSAIAVLAVVNYMGWR
jgi:hypothetical protein